MSGSGGFYKYHCKYFLSHNCQEWVYKNGEPCAKCLADGRDSNESDVAAPAWKFSREICVPRVQDGILQYILMDLVATGEIGNHWTLKEQVQPPPAIMVTNDMPGQILAVAGGAASMRF